MLNTAVYSDISAWKKPLHATKAQLAKNYLKLLPFTKIIGITGSVGKTLTQRAIYQVLSQKYKVAVGNDNLDPSFRIPQTILKTKPWDQYMILEYGIEYAQDMDYYLSIAKPNIAIITKITPTHTKYLEDINGVYEQKSKLIKTLSPQSIALINSSDPYQKDLGKNTKATKFYFGPGAKSGVKISHFTQNKHGSKFRMHFQGKMETVTWKPIGRHQLLSAYIAATIGTISKLTLKQIVRGLSQVEPPTHRLNVKETDKYTLIDDTYNSSPDAASEAIKTLVEVANGKRKVAVLGEMRDLGEISKTEHQKLGKIIANTNISTLITVGEVAKTISNSTRANKFKGHAMNLETCQEVASYIKNNISKNAYILIKGSRHEHLERIVLALTGKSTAINCYQCGKLK